MSVAHGPAATVPTTECRVCQVEVPAGEFCVLCGVRLESRPGDGPEWLRPRNYGAAPGEHLLRPSLASSLFPQLPPRSRTVFRVALIAELLAARVDAMPAPTGDTVRAMACLGGRTHLGLLAAAIAETPEVVEQRLAPALNEGVLVIGTGAQEAVQFGHDRR